jgi:hypothetical protein
VAWVPEQFRFSAFHAPGKIALPDWKQIFGAEPDSIQEHPKSGVTFQTGDWAGVKLRYAASKERIDWVVFPNVEAMQVPASLPGVGDFPAKAEEFLATILESISIENQFVRVAFGVILNEIYPDLASAGQQLKEKYLRAYGVPLDDPEDFFLQFNTPIKSASLDGLRLNRLLKWQVVQTGVLEVEAAMTPTAGQPQVQAPISLLKHLRLEIDVNTDAARRTPFTATQLKGLWPETLSTASAIANNGVGG